MNFEQYKAQRTELMNEAEELIAEGKLEESEAKMQEVKDLDNTWEGVKLAQANLNALKDNDKASKIEDKSEKVKGGKVMDEIKNVNQELSQDEIYQNAWAKNMMGQKLEGEEQEVFNKVNTDFNNAFTHDTGNTGIL